MYLFRITVRLSNQETPCTDEASNSQFKVKSCYALLRKQMLCIHGYLKSLLRYKFLILDTHHPDTIFSSARRWRSAVTFRSQKSSASKPVSGNIVLLRSSFITKTYGRRFRTCALLSVRRIFMCTDHIMCNLTILAQWHMLSLPQII
jgi:hypothetical protein